MPACGPGISHTPKKAQLWCPSYRQDTRAHRVEGPEEPVQSSINPFPCPQLASLLGRKELWDLRWEMSTHWEVCRVRPGGWLQYCWCCPYTGKVSARSKKPGWKVGKGIILIKVLYVFIFPGWLCTCSDAPASASRGCDRPLGPAKSFNLDLFPPGCWGSVN